VFTSATIRCVYERNPAVPAALTGPEEAFAHNLASPGGPADEVLAEETVVRGPGWRDAYARVLAAGAEALRARGLFVEDVYGEDDLPTPTAFRRPAGSPGHREPAGWLRATTTIHREVNP
jgi:hypothetical protein